MRLLDGKSLQLVSFSDENKTPPFAILSHTWVENEEVSFQDMMSNTGTVLTAKSGWAKIENACRLALSFGLDYVWIDTCCIDKTSSAELQEAMNSMFRWYQLAKICFAFLSDVSASEDHSIKGSPLRRSRWFKRGWTLQELLAPTEVAFYDKDWKPIFTRGSMGDLIEDITGIRKLFLFNEYRRGGICDMLSTASVAERMSWMTKRETKMPEDLAYCLLGIFDVNMPMIYGEGHKAFQRLQEEIMNQSDDSSLLSWGYEHPYSHWHSQEKSLLAPRPSLFRGCRDLVPCIMPGFKAASFAMNQRGLQMEVPVRLDLTHQLLAYIILGCSPRLRTEWSTEKTIPRSFVAIPLVSTRAYNVFERDQGTQKGEYLRPQWCKPILVSEEFLGQAQSMSIVIRRYSEQLHKFQELPISIAVPPFLILQGYTILGTYPPQPIGSRLVLVSLQAGVPQNVPGSTGYVPPPPNLNKKISLSIIYSKDHQTMIQIRIEEIGTFVVVLGYRVVAWRMAQCITGWQCSDISCRVFKTPENCGLEDLHSLSITQDFTHLPEVDSVFRQDRYLFKIGFGAEACLVIQLTKDDTLTGITDVFISVWYPLGHCRNQEERGEIPRSNIVDVRDLREDLRAIGPLQKDVSVKLLHSVDEQLQKQFPSK
ncbi:hypothetical protein FSST1_002984 [Fusarium sambucinum]